MSYNVNAYTPETENESFSDVAHMRITSTTDLVDSILFGQLVLVVIIKLTTKRNIFSLKKKFITIA